MLNLDGLYRTGNRYADQYLNAAERLGLDTRIIEGGGGLAIISGNGRRLAVRGAMLGCNDLVATRLSSNKYLTHLALGRDGCPVPEFLYLDTSRWRRESDWLSAIRDFAAPRLPVVLKPVKGQGGHCVYAGIEDLDELCALARELQRWTTSEFLVERHARGRNYRAQVLDGELIGLIERHPPQVVGDGESTVARLIEQRNRRRRALGLAGFQITERASRLLAQHGRHLDSILADRQRQALSVEYSEAGSTVRIETQQLAAALASTLCRAVDCLGLRWAAVDFIARDLVTAPAEVIVHEVNSASDPNDPREDESISQYLAPATEILRRLFFGPTGDRDGR